MSAKKSWDVRREPAKPPAKTRRKRASKPPKERGPKSLRERRRAARTAFLGTAFLVFLIIAGGITYLCWRPEVRITTVQANGESDSAISVIAKRELVGTYFYVIPRDSIFFYPDHAVRQAILDAYPGVSAISISRSGFNSISVRTITRVAAFWWCGTPEAASAEERSCYEADAEGFIFAPVENGAVLATSTAISTLRIYGELATASTTTNYPLRAHMKHVESIPEALRFVRAMNKMNIPIVSLSIHDDEADVFVPSGTRISYVLGKEEDAVQLAQSAFPTLNLMDGSLLYVDLRFPGKVYLRKSSDAQ